MRDFFPQPLRELRLREDQRKLVGRCRKLETDGNAEGRSWTTLKSPPLVKFWLQRVPAELGLHRGVGVGKAECVLDTSALNAAARYFLKFSREHKRRSKEQGDVARVFVSRESEHDFMWARIKVLPFPLLSREFVQRQVCCTDASNAIVVASEPPRTKTRVDYGTSMNVVRGTIVSFVRFTPAGNEQCKLTLYQRADVAGRVPVFLVNRMAGRLMSPAAAMREQYQRDDEVDEAERRALMTIITGEQVSAKRTERIEANVRGAFLTLRLARSKST
jgi:hypothetical protein